MPLCTFPAALLLLPLLLLLLAARGRAASLTPRAPLRWHTLTLLFRGPRTSETAVPNPFLHFRLDVVFAHAGSAFEARVPGFYAADGAAAHTSAAAGDAWAARFTPPRTGAWTYRAEFLEGPRAAVTAEGRPAYFHGDAGSFHVAETRASPPDLRASGRLQYVGQRYFRHANGEYRLKLGTNTPENLLGYVDFDGDDGVFSFDAHLDDWREGDPTWGPQAKGKALIGALNYLAASRVNSLFAILMTIKGDADSHVHPWLSVAHRARYDVSRLEQWSLVFDYASSLGITLNLAFLETENEALFEHEERLSTATGFADTRKLFYRELIARFAHNLGCTFTLGEENGWTEGKPDDVLPVAERNGPARPWGIGNSDLQRRLFTQYIRAADPYSCPIAVHTFPRDKDAIFTPMLGPTSGARVESASLQLPRKNLTAMETGEWVSRSTAAGMPWVVTADEFGRDTPADVGGVPLDKAALGPGVRGAFAWGHFLAGGAGLEVFAGPADQKLEDFRRFDQAWAEFSRPLRLMQRHGIPFWAMRGADAAVERARDAARYGVYTWAFAREGDVYVVYASRADDVVMRFADVEGDFHVRWFDPRRGASEELRVGSVPTVSGGDDVWLGRPPADGDWVAVVAREVPRRRARLTGVSPHDLVPGAVTMGASEGHWG